jgi:hypothetical protein
MKLGMHYAYLHLPTDLDKGTQQQCVSRACSLVCLFVCLFVTVQPKASMPFRGI